MKRTFRNVLLIGVIVCAFILVTGCGKKNPIIGTWTYEGGGFTYTFNEDKTGTYEAFAATLEFTYTAENNKLSILYKDNTKPFETDYTIEDNKLIIKDSFGNNTVYVKK
jgi:hypothetical protein